MPLTIWNYVLSFIQKNYFSENQLVWPRNYFHKRISNCNFVLPTFLTGSKWDFQGANLLLATVNFEPCYQIVYNILLFSLKGVPFSSDT